MTKNTVFHNPAARIASILAVSAMALGLAACDKMKEPTVGQKLDSAVANTERAAAEVKVDAEKAMQSAQDKMAEGAAKTEAAAEKAGNQIREAGSAAMDVVDDAAITAHVSAGLAKDPALSALKIDVDTHNGTVTLNGPAPTQEAKDRATGIAQGVKGVSSVVNQLILQTR